MTPAELEARLAAEGLHASTWSNAAGDTYATHQHGYDKALVVTAGSITFHLVNSGTDISLSAGDRLDLPAGTAHGATVGAYGVSCLEAHVAAGAAGGAPRRRAAGEW